MEELVSCILATGNRNRFVPQALRCFGAQTYPHRELIVVDDGEEPVRHLCRGVERVKYLRLDRRRSLGAKLNLGIELAAGTIIQKLDDDDYYAPGFLATSVARLRESRLRRSIAVWDCFLALLVTEPKLALYYSGHGWLAGGTMCFRRSIWEEAPFRKITWGEDSAFFEDHPGPRLRICAPEEYIIVRHGRNTWRRFVDGRRVESFFRERRPYRKSLAEVAGMQAAHFYVRLNRSAAA